MTRELDRLAQDYNPRHSAFQVERFILGRQPTLYGVYKQALRELFTRFETLCDAIEKMSDERPDHKKFADEVSFRTMFREFCQIFIIATKAKDELGELDEDQLSSEYWEAKVRQDIAMDLVATGRLDRSTFELITSLPPASRKRILSEIKEDSGRKTVIHDFENRPSFVPAATREEVDALVDRGHKAIIAEARDALTSG